MKERMVDIATPDGKMETFVIHPEDGGPFAPVVVYRDIWGVREELFEIARPNRLPRTECHGSWDRSQV